MDLRFIAEFIGTAILVYLGDSVVANCILNKTKGFNGGLIVIGFGWACAVLVPATIFGSISAHFNPALSLALASIGRFDWALLPGYVISQFAGAIIGAVAVYIQYKDHFDATEDKDCKLGVFCTGPAIRNFPINLISEIFGTFILVFTLVALGKVDFAGGLSNFAVMALILSIGISLGGTTGYAINPARDLGPRIAHAILPIKDKRDPDWAYSWIPVVGPIIGALLGASLGAGLGF